MDSADLTTTAGTAGTSSKQNQQHRDDLDVSKNSGTPKSSILIGFSVINHPFWGTPMFGNIHLTTQIYLCLIQISPANPNLKSNPQLMDTTSKQTPIARCSVWPNTLKHTKTRNLRRYLPGCWQGSIETIHVNGSMPDPENSNLSKRKNKSSHLFLQQRNPTSSTLFLGGDCLEDHPSLHIVYKLARITPPFISHGKTIWKGSHTPIRGQQRSP